MSHKILDDNGLSYLLTRIKNGTKTVGGESIWGEGDINAGFAGFVIGLYIQNPNSDIVVDWNDEDRIKTVLNEWCTTSTKDGQSTNFNDLMQFIIKTNCLLASGAATATNTLAMVLSTNKLTVDTGSMMVDRHRRNNFAIAYRIEPGTETSNLVPVKRPLIIVFDAIGTLDNTHYTIQLQMDWSMTNGKYACNAIDYICKTSLNSSSLTSQIDTDNVPTDATYSWNLWERTGEGVTATTKCNNEYDLELNHSVSKVDIGIGSQVGTIDEYPEDGFILNLTTSNKHLSNYRLIIEFNLTSFFNKIPSGSKIINVRGKNNYENYTGSMAPVAPEDGNFFKFAATSTGANGTGVNLGYLIKNILKLPMTAANVKVVIDFAQTIDVYKVMTEEMGLMIPTKFDSWVFYGSIINISGANSYTLYIGAPSDEISK